MDAKWFNTRRGRITAAVGGVAIVAVAALALVAAGDSESEDDVASVEAATSTADDVGSSEVSASTAEDAPPEETSPTTAPPTVPGPTPAPADVDANTTARSLETVPVETVIVLDQIALDEVGDFGTGLSVRLVDIEAIDGEARMQGEIAGPALRVEVEVTNDSDAEISLERTLVEVTYGDESAPGQLLSGSGTTPFATSIAPGESATSTVVYGVPLNQRDLVQIRVTQTTGTPIVVFEGVAP